MWSHTCIPRKVYQVLYPFKKCFRCPQAQHFLVCCWLLMALIRAPGKGTLKGLGAYLPPKLKYWTTLRMIRSARLSLFADETHMLPIERSGAVAQALAEFLNPT